MYSSTLSGLPPYSSTPIANPTFSPSSSSSSLPTTLQASEGTAARHRTVRFQTPGQSNKPNASYGLLKQQQHHGDFSSSQGAAASQIATAAPSTPPPSYVSDTESSSRFIHSGGSRSGGRGGNGRDDGQVVRPSLLQPRVAAVLGVSRRWHLPLFACRLLSMCPAIWWSLGIFIRLITQLHALAVAQSGFGGPSTVGGVAGRGLTDMSGAGAGSFPAATGSGAGLSLESRLKLTETGLAMIWATIVRLLAINALNGYLTSWVIYLMGSGGDSRLLLPAWVAIAAILTGLYHGTQRKINIRKETSISISVFSGASFISMVSLLAQLYWDRPEYVDVPVVALARRVCAETARVAGNLFDIGNITMDL
ncbi:hypothetical protein SEPCBS57363_000654 [Sporothrix epigloea]|uniref:N-glycosylation protein EOS1 n=1 Tax=Sporothrix epigloea TaxID=1892477 RepID=A0ABP0D915_9PEZI